MSTKAKHRTLSFTQISVYIKSELGDHKKYNGKKGKNKVERDFNSASIRRTTVC